LIDIETAAEKTADLTERQLVPAINRLSRGIEQLAQATGVAPAAESQQPSGSAAQRPAPARPAAEATGRSAQAKE
jgi:hypothetical protein